MGMNQDEKSLEIYEKISQMIAARKTALAQAVNAAMVFLYWEVGEMICLNLLNNGKAEYGRRIIEDVAERLAKNYGKIFSRASVYR